MAKARLIDGIQPGPEVRFRFDGQEMTGFEGEGLSGALLRAGMDASRRTASFDQPRGYYCGMGLCWECVVDVEGLGPVRGCRHPVTEGLIARPLVQLKRKCE